MLFLQPPLQRQALLRATLPANKQQYLWQNTLLNSFTYGYEKVTMQDGDFGLELLFPPRMHGCFYMHGIYTARMCKDYDQTLQLVRFGVNYTGSTAVLEQCYQFNRDKNQPHCGPAAVLGAAQGHPSACEAGAAARG
uniref:Uncharacterized protein n=1 Tax=Tetradesmus obliquus TaxID=3088 RepID=A0A383WE32_TETOB